MASVVVVVVGVVLMAVDSAARVAVGVSTNGADKALIIHKYPPRGVEKIFEGGARGGGGGGGGGRGEVRGRERVPYGLLDM